MFRRLMRDIRKAGGGISRWCGGGRPFEAVLGGLAGNMLLLRCPRICSREHAHDISNDGLRWSEL
jgi:hypothetical protein